MATELLEWDASSYDALPLPHRQWGATAIAKLGLTGSERVLDLGCGTGRDARHLLDILDTGHVVAVDGSLQMLTQLRQQLAENLDRVTILHADLREPLIVSEPVDAALSVATLHWLPDHAAVFRSVAAVLRPGGRFVAEAGGAGNIASIRAALIDVSGDDGAGLWHFATVDETVRRLEDAGFSDINVRLVPDPAVLRRGAQLEAFLATVMLGAQVRDLPLHLRRPFVRSVAERLDEPVVDYVRLQLSATRT